MPQQQQDLPGTETEMIPEPIHVPPGYVGTGKLQDKRAIITGGDSGIGKAVAILFAIEGADVAIVYKEEDEDAEETKHEVEKHGKSCLLFPRNIQESYACKEVVEQVASEWEGIDILVNNAGEQHPAEEVTEIDFEMMQQTFKTNIFSFFYMTKYAVPALRRSEHSCIINTTSVTAFRGSEHLLDYSSTKGAIISFTRSLALMLVEDNIRVNAVAPGPIWTPLIPASFSAEEVSTFGSHTPMKRAAQPWEVAPSFVFLASHRDSSYMTGQTLHPNGGEIVNA